MDARIISEVEPTSVFTGRIWIKLSTMTAYIRLGSAWIPIISDVATYDFNNDVTIFINGVDRTSYIEKESIIIDDILTQEVNTCSFVFVDETETADYKPFIGQEVLIYYRVTVGSDPILIFGGRINECPQRKFSLRKYSYDILCSDYTQDLSRILVSDNFTAQTAGAIIRSIITDYVKPLGTYFVEDGETINYISFSYRYPQDCINELAELIGYDWYVDYEKNLHFFKPLTNIAPYSLTDNSANGEYYNLNITIDKSHLINKQIVRGGYELSSLFTEEQVADGTQISFNLKYQPYAPVSVLVDIGAGYVAHTLGIDNIDAAGYDFVVNAKEKNIKNLDHAVLAAGHKLKITYKYNIPVLAQVEDNDSISLMQQYEGGDGIYEGNIIIDETIQTKQASRDRGNAELLQYSNPLIEGTFTTTQYGYTSGQLLTVNIPSRNINGIYLIRQVTTNYLGLGLFEYEITFATKLKGLTDFLTSLYDSGRKTFLREDEILDILKTFTLENIVTSDVLSYTSTSSTGFSVWCDDAGTTLNKGRWNFFVWK